MHISETIEFLTQIIPHWNGTEQRSSVRPLPRRTLSYDYIGTNSWQSQYLRSMAYAQQTQLFQFPVWHATTRLKADMLASMHALEVGKNAIWGWRGATHGMLWMGDEYGGETFPVSSTSGDGTVTFNKATSSDWKAGSTIVTPVIWGILKNEDKFISSCSSCSEMGLNVQIVKEPSAPSLPASLNHEHDENQKYPFCNGLPSSYNGIEIFRLSPSWEGEVTSDYSRNAVLMDNKTGVFRYDLRGYDPTERRELPFLMHTRAEINNMQRFFYRMKGRCHSFMAPTWLQDVTLVDDALNGMPYLLAKFPGYWKYFTKTSRRRLLVVFRKDNTAEIIKVSGYSTNDTGEYGKIWLNGNLKRPLLKKDVRMISFLCRYRFDSDSMVTDYETQQVATTSLPFAEVTA